MTIELNAAKTNTQENFAPPEAVEKAERALMLDPLSTQEGQVSALPSDISEEELLKVEERVCSHGDTVHYAKDPKFFETCKGSYLYDGENNPYLDLQMWYSAVNLGYANERVNDALKKQ